jgi:tetratricopeptide (TPR) repeat protein
VRAKKAGPHFATLLLAALSLAACGGSPADPGPPPDQKLDAANRAGTQALSLGMPAQAVRQYKQALARAYERDDAEAIADTAYNLALAEIRAGDPKAALATTRATEAELRRRQVAAPAELLLVQAAAAYRAGDLTTAASAAEQALTLKARDPDTAPRAWFIRGLVAADRGDSATLAQAIAALPAAASAKQAADLQAANLQADRQELVGRAALLDGRAADALVAFEQAAANRQQAIDYRGMARALAQAGEAALKLGQSAEAAVFYLRAGRSSLLQGDSAAATPQLKRAEELARQTSQTGIVEEIARLRKAAAEKRAAGT